MQLIILGTDGLQRMDELSSGNTEKEKETNLSYSSIANRKKSTWRDFLFKHEESLLAILMLFIFSALWELIAVSGLVKPIFISSPSHIFQAAVWLAGHGLWNDILVSLIEFAVGFLMAIVIAVPLGLLLGWYRRLNAMFDPFISALNATPRVALIPLIILWLGIGIESKIAVVFLGAFFPLILNVMVGAKTVDSALLMCARSFGASQYKVFITLVLPTTLPFLIVGMRLAVGRALVGVVVAEMISSSAGLGHLIYITGSTFQTDKLFVGVLVLACFGYLLTEILKRLEAHFEIWRPERRQS